MTNSETNGPPPPNWEVDPDPVRLEMREEIMRLQAKVAALEARLAEVVPVVEAAIATVAAEERFEAAVIESEDERDHHREWLHTQEWHRDAVVALRAARAKKEGGA